MSHDYQMSTSHGLWDASGSPRNHIDSVDVLKYCEVTDHDGKYAESVIYKNVKYCRNNVITLKSESWIPSFLMLEKVKICNNSITFIGRLLVGIRHVSKFNGFQGSISIFSKSVNYDDLLFPWPVYSYKNNRIITCLMQCMYSSENLPL